MTARILIADDEDSLRWVLEKGLRQAGYDVISVKDGGAAIRAVEDEAFDLVVLDARMQDVYTPIARIAGSDVTVLLRGESGTGKELVARAIHHYSRRAGRPFVAVSAAAIPSTLLESEMFGHERGAFTDAKDRRLGKFELAHGGTLYLDEIGDMPLDLQAKVLRALQERTIERLGGQESIRIDVRVLAATHRDPEALLREGKFR